MLLVQKTCMERLAFFNHKPKMLGPATTLFVLPDSASFLDSKERYRKETQAPLAVFHFTNSLVHVCIIRLRCLLVSLLDSSSSCSIDDASYTGRVSNTGSSSTT